MKLFTCALALAGVGSTAAIGCATSSGSPAHHADGSPAHRRATVRRAPLVFGIYPGGAAGTFGPSGKPKPEDPAKRLAALNRLRPAGRPFVLHIYASYSSPGGPSAAAQVGRDIAEYGAAGLRTELVVTYRPTTGGSPADVAAFARFIRSTVRSLGPDPGFVSLQVTNEANEGGGPNTSDGYYRGARDALIRGVIAAKSEIRRGGFRQVKVGFNWAFDFHGAADRAFWSYLGRRGGRTFVAALDWVGFDIFPGTWGPRVRSSNLAGGTTGLIRNALRRLRTIYLPLAHIPASVPLRISENGYPTGPGRTQAMQITMMRAALAAVDSARYAYNITDYRWFDLRDAISSSSSFETQYGLLRDDYSRKRGFDVYRQLVARLSRPHPAPARW